MTGRVQPRRGEHVVKAAGAISCIQRNYLWTMAWDFITMPVEGDSAEYNDHKIN